MRSVLSVHWKYWCWSWSSNTLAICCEELTHLKRPWCWERLKAGGEGDDRGWDGWMASLIQWTWVWVNSESWWWTGRPGVLQFMRSQRAGHNWATELNWTPNLKSVVGVDVFRVWETADVEWSTSHLQQEFRVLIQQIFSKLLICTRHCASHG